MLAKRLNISRNQLFEAAIEAFIENPDNQAVFDDSSRVAQDAKTTPQNREQLVINQGDIFWVQLDDASGLEPGIPHPHVVVQDNIFNHSRIHSVVTCALTSNVKRVDRPGNVLLEGGEANLPRQSVVEVSKVFALDKTQLGEYIGTVSQQRINQVLAGMRFLQTSFLGR